MHTFHSVNFSWNINYSVILQFFSFMKRNIKSLIPYFFRSKKKFSYKSTSIWNSGTFQKCCSVSFLRNWIWCTTEDFYSLLFSSNREIFCFSLLESFILFNSVTNRSSAKKQNSVSHQISYLISTVWLEISMFWDIKSYKNSYC